MGTRLFVGNLSFDTTEQALMAAFGTDGRRVASLGIVMDRDTGRSRGFVEMESDGDAQGAIKALNGSQINGRTLRVSEAEERKPRSGGGGGGGDRRGARDRW